MIFMPVARAAASTLAVGAIAFCAPEMSAPARLNMPPLETKSFSISTTITAVFFGLIAIGSGFASTVTTPLLAADEPACSPSIDPGMSDVLRIAFAIGLFMAVLLSVIDHPDKRRTEV